MRLKKKRIEIETLNSTLTMSNLTVYSIDMYSGRRQIYIKSLK